MTRLMTSPAEEALAPRCCPGETQKMSSTTEAPGPSRKEAKGHLGPAQDTAGPGLTPPGWEWTPQSLPRRERSQGMMAQCHREHSQGKPGPVPV